MPILKSPRWMLANRAARFVLKMLHNPEPPIPVEAFIKKQKWEVLHEELGGPDGCMVKMTYRNQTKFFIYLATDQDPESLYDQETIRRRQAFTLAHELGHILLHSNFIVNSADLSYLSSETADIMEVEAHWFASRLLMPNYAFRNVTDLIPDQLADKCGVNITPATKRLKNLSPSIRNSLMESIRLDKWPEYEKTMFLPTSIFPQQLKYATWESYEQAAATSNLLYICSRCGLLHTDHTIMFQYCTECNAELVNAREIF